MGPIACCPDPRTFGYLEQILPLSRRITPVGFGNVQQQTRAGIIHLTQLARRRFGRSGQALEPPHEFQAEPVGIQPFVGKNPLLRLSIRTWFFVEGYAPASDSSKRGNRL
jgi:hypothetical protein